jgi:hypothetical protein
MGRLTHVHVEFERSATGGRRVSDRADPLRPQKLHGIEHGVRSQASRNASALKIGRRQVPVGWAAHGSWPSLSPLLSVPFLQRADSSLPLM